METTTVTPNGIASAFHATVTSRGFTIHVKPGLVTIKASFAPNDRSAYVAHDMDAYGLLAMLPTTASGSVWGTTSDGVGGHAGLVGGYYRLSKSGVSKRVTSALAKLPGVRSI